MGRPFQIRRVIDPCRFRLAIAPIARADVTDFTDFFEPITRGRFTHHGQGPDTDDQQAQC
jgi:hypothetical protein